MAHRQKTAIKSYLKNCNACPLLQLIHPVEANANLSFLVHDSNVSYGNIVKLGAKSLSLHSLLK